MVKNYGPFAIGTHAAVYAFTLGCVYNLVGQGVDFASLVAWLPYYTDKEGLEATSSQVGTNPTPPPVLCLVSMYHPV